MDEAQFNAINTAKTAGKVGDYPLSYQTADGTGVTVTISLRASGEDGKEQDPDNPLDVIGANDNVSKTGGSPLSAQQVKTLCAVVAREASGNRLDLADVTVDNAQLDALNADKVAEKIGPYPLTFTTPGGASANATLTLRKDGTQPQSDASWGSNPFSHYNRDGALTAEQILEKGEVIARDEQGNLIVPNAVSEKLQQLNAKITANEQGTFAMPFTMPDGTQLTVKITLLPSYTVLFTDADGAQYGKITDLIKGDTFSRPQDPQKQGYRFGGWTRRPQIPWDFAAGQVEQDLVLYAKWTSTATTPMPLPITGDMGWGLFAWLGAVLAGGAGVALAVWKKRTAGNNGRH